VPSISVILKKIHKFPDDEAMTDDDLESAYIELLKKDSLMQDYLKIDDNFVFFMDLAKNRFLADAVSGLHGDENSLMEEMTRDCTLLDDFGKFEGRYGEDNAHIGMNLKGVYTDYETRLRKLMIKSGASLSILLYRAQEWFFAHIAGSEVQTTGKDLSEAFVGQLNNMLRDFMAEYSDVVDEYKDMVNNYLQRVSFSQHKRPMEGIIANVLDLLAWLKEKNVAIRDIKPDNLLVAGDQSKYPHFLSTPESFSIGLIDVETAVCFLPGEGEKIKQPPLGGTPFYATPLHFFKNKTLKKVYNDLPRCIYLQDWFAVAAMIYGTITGKHVFLQTAKHIVSSTKYIQKASKEKKPIKEIVNTVNKTFWASALSEFNTNTRQNKDRLDAIRVTLMNPVQEMILSELAAEKLRKDNLIKQLINKQIIFKNKPNREQLYLSSPERLSQIITTLKTKDGVDASSLDMIEAVRQLKEELQENASSCSLVQERPTDISAYQVMKIMFYIALNFMYKDMIVSQQCE